MKVKAKIVMPEKDGYQPIIYIERRWRATATPYSPKDENMRLYGNKKSAKRGAEKVAAASNMTLDWEA